MTLKILNFYLFFFLIPICFAKATENKKSFSFHVLTEPNSLDPSLALKSSGYVLSTLYRGLFSYKNKKLVNEGAKSCQIKNKKVLCILNKRYWSNGKAIVAQDYVRAFENLIQNRSPLLENFLNIKNLTTNKDNTLVFHLYKKDPEFLYRLIHPALSPRPKKAYFKKEKAYKILSSGPYQVTKWISGTKLVLKNNPFYHKKKLKVQKLIVFFIQEDKVALNLYEKGELSFLRRLTTDKIPIYKKRKDFYFYPLLRWDYLGFSKLVDKNLKKALAYSLNYMELKKILNSPSLPSCPTLPRFYYKKKHCVQFDKKQALKNLSLYKKKKKKERLKISISHLGAADTKKIASWMVWQWKKHLNLNIEIQVLEQGLFLDALKKRKLQIFRKGFYLERPSCKAAIKIFSKNHPENYIDFKSKNLERLLQKKFFSKKDCSLAHQLLIQDASLVPQGEIFYASLLNPKFKNLNLNELGQIFLEDLKY